MSAKILHDVPEGCETSKGELFEENGTQYRKLCGALSKLAVRVNALSEVRRFGNHEIVVVERLHQAVGHDVTFEP